MWRSIFLASLFACGMSLFGCTHHHHEKEKEAEKSRLPYDIEVKGKAIARVKAEGVQVYTWQADTNAWKFKEPEASFGGEGLKGKHYAGPTWEAEDGSKVMGSKVAESPSPNSDAIPWLLIEATSHEGSGKLSQVTFIQRIKTTGGKAPSTSGTKDGEETRVPYTAEYVFYGPGATTRP